MRSARDANPAIVGHTWARVLKRRYHLHAPGLAYAGTLMVVVLGAINGQNNLLFWLFGLGVGGLLLSGIVSGAALMGLELRRESDRVGAVGEPMTIRYHLRSKNWLFPTFAVTIEELPGLRRGKHSSTWSRHMGPVVAYAPHVATKGSAIAEATVTPGRRGRVDFCEVRVSSTFPFGLTKKSVTFVQPTELLIRPRIAEVSAAAVQLVSARGDSGQTSRRSRAGDEFFALREFASGDTIRRVAWKPSARLGRALVREMCVRPGRRIWLGGSGAGDQAEPVVGAMAGVIRALLARGMDVGVFSGEGIVAPARSGTGHLQRCLDALATIDPGVSAGDPGFGPQDHVLIVSAGGEVAVAGARVVSIEQLGVPIDFGVLASRGTVQALEPTR